MASGFKQATVNAASVPATQTNFPSYVDLSRIGITTLAEAQSVRVYADSGKTTEWAREIVSATEMWVKVPSLTSTVTMYVDYDGVRADYAVTDTYGRNNVWTMCSGSYRLDSANDSTGNYNLTNNGTTAFPAGFIGNGANFANTNNKYLFINNATPLGLAANSTVSVTFWFKIISETSAEEDMFSLVWTGGSGLQLRGLYEHNGGSRRLRFYKIGSSATFLDISGNRGDNVYRHAAFTYNSSNGALAFYLNAAAPVTGTNTTTATSGATAGFDIGDTRLSGYTAGFNGIIDQFNVYPSVLSANWITTEYNNQSAESTFWGTWTTVGGGGGPVKRGGILLAW